MRKFKLRITYFTIIILLFQFGCNSNKSSSGNFAKKKNELSDSTNSLTSITKPNFNIYIENSASIDGYVSTESDFKNSVYGIITDIKAKDLCGKINLNYINDTVCPFKGNALPQDIEYFIKNLNPQTFKNNGCSRKDSYLPDIIKQVISIKPDDVNVLVSDYIFSTGKGNSPQYLIQQKNSVELVLAEELKKHDFSTIIVKLNSLFNGKYFIENANDVKNKVLAINCRRPYYIIIFGKHENLTGILSKLKFNEYSGFETSYYLLTPNANKPTSKAIRTNKIGDFEIEQPATKLILNGAKTNENKDFQFSLATNLEFLKMDESYLSDTANYEVPSNYKLVSIQRNDDLTNEGLKGYTHVFTIHTSDLKQNQEVFIKLKSKLPPWVLESSTEDDSNPLDPIQQKKTFGFKYLIQGISEAYADKYEGKEQFGINVKVSCSNYNSHGTSSKFPWWILVLLAGVIGTLLYLKNKK